MERWKMHLAKAKAYVVDRLAESSTWIAVRFLLALIGPFFGLHLLSWWAPVMSLDWAQISTIVGGSYAAWVAITADKKGV